MEKTKNWEWGAVGGVEGGLGGAREEKGKIEEGAIKRERNRVLVFLNLEMLNPFFSLSQPAFLGH